MSIQKIREALEPFAKHASDETDVYPDDELLEDVWFYAEGVTHGDLRRAREALALLDDLAKVDERALEAGVLAAAALRMIGSAGRLNDPDVSEMFRERIRAETRAAIAAYLAALTETKK